MVERKDVSGILGTVNTIVSIQSGSVGLLGQPVGVSGTIQSVQSGSVGILGQPVGVSGTIQSVQSGSVGIFDYVGGAGAGSANTSVNVISTSTLLLDGDSSRKYAAVQVLPGAGTPVYLSFGVAAVVGNGLVLNAGGVSDVTGAAYEINSFNLWRGSVFGISAGGTVTVGKVAW